VARVDVADVAAADLDELIATHHLPPDTRTRVARTLRVLERFPESGRALIGAWDGFRLLIGPWRWMLIVYAYESGSDAVTVVSFQDARTSTAATAQQ
jgi:hypothetical protein